MCAGAIINARISTVVYGAKEPNSGSVGSVINLFEERYGHRPAVYGGVLEDECARCCAAFSTVCARTRRRSRANDVKRPPGRAGSGFMPSLCLRGPVRVEERELAESDYIGPVVGVALGEDGHLARNDAAGAG